MAGILVGRAWHRALVVVLAAGVLSGCATRSAAPAAEPDAEERSERERPRGQHELGAVSEVDGDDLHGIPATQMEEMLEGRVAGVQVVRIPGGGISIRIRGRTSFHGDNEPLYVVDGMPVSVRPGRGLDWLNPGDIKSIRVLKDAAETAFYGMRGANGVVLITTRRGQ
jgi:TonB-dependent SusC/RagA subfamily outer membrane receptor